jgi:hypothetical protein
MAIQFVSDNMMFGGYEYFWRSSSKLFIISGKLPCYNTFRSDSLGLRVFVSCLPSSSDQGSFCQELFTRVFITILTVELKKLQPLNNNAQSYIVNNINAWIAESWEQATRDYSQEEVLRFTWEKSTFAVLIVTDVWSIYSLPVGEGYLLLYTSSSDNLIRKVASQSNARTSGSSTRMNAFQLVRIGGGSSSIANVVGNLGPIASQMIDQVLDTHVGKIRSIEFMRPILAPHITPEIYMFGVQDLAAHKRWLQWYYGQQNALFHQQKAVSFSNAPKASEQKAASPPQAKREPSGRRNKQANQQEVVQPPVKPQALTRRHPLQGPIKGKCEVWFGPCDRMYDKRSQPLPLDPDYVYVPSFGKVICRDEYLNGWRVVDDRKRVILRDRTVLIYLADFPHSWNMLMIKRRHGR